MPPQIVDLLIEARWVLPIAPVNTALAHHAVAVTEGRIVALGPIEELRQRFESREPVVRGDHHVLLPGFVNAHTRAATALLRGLPVKGPRQRWMRDTVVPTARELMSPDFVREGTKLAIAEMLRAGITSFSDMYLFPEEAARVASAARVHAAIGLPVTDGPTVWAESATGHLAKAERLWDEYKADPWVSLYFAPHHAFAQGDQTLSRVRRVADELDARVAMYVAAGELPPAQPGDGSPLMRLQELGLLGPGFTAIHLDADAEGLDIAAATGISIVACQQSHLRLGASACPLSAFAARGLNVGLGTDSPLSVGALDMLAEARTEALLAGWETARAGSRTDHTTAREGAATARVADAAAAYLGDAAAARAGTAAARVADAAAAYLGDAAAPKETVAESVLRFATLGGANVLGLGAQIGSLEVGKSADLVCIDLDTLPCQAHSRPADALVFAATRNQVTDVWTAGRPAIRAGHLLTFDEQELLALARSWAERIPAGVNS